MFILLFVVIYIVFGVAVPVLVVNLLGLVPDDDGVQLAILMGLAWPLVILVLIGYVIGISIYRFVKYLS